MDTEKRSKKVRAVQLNGKEPLGSSLVKPSEASSRTSRTPSFKRGLDVNQVLGVLNHSIELHQASIFQHKKTIIPRNLFSCQL